MNRKENVKKVKLLLIVFSFFALFSFSEKVYADYTVINSLPQTINHNSYPVNTVVVAPYDNLSQVACNTSNWYALNGSSDIVTSSYFMFTTCGNLGYTGYVRQYWTANTWATTTNAGYYYEYFVNNGTPTETTQIITVTPYSGQTIATSSTNTIGATGYLNTGDQNENTKLKINLQNSNFSFTQCADVICATFASSSINRDFSYTLSDDGAFSYSSTTRGLPVGKYYVTTKIEKGSYCLLGFCLYSTTLVSTSTTFIVSTTTRIDKIKDNTVDYIDDLTGSTYSFDDCTITSFSFFRCFSDLALAFFVPSNRSMSHVTETLHDTILTHFPIGYVTDFISKISTTTVGTLTPINATIPNGVIGTGATITLDLTNVFDSMLNATTGVFTNVSASSTETFFEITNYYWQMVLYLLAGLYILRRILGSGVIPEYNHFGEKGSLSDTSSKDDSYRLKEWLYKNKK